MGRDGKAERTGDEGRGTETAVAGQPGLGIAEDRVVVLTRLRLAWL